MSNTYYTDDNQLNSIRNKKNNELVDNLSISKTTLKSYINSKKTQFGDKTLTHQWWDNEGNTNFKIEDASYDDFLKVYIKELKNTTDNNVLHVMEQPMEIGPLCLDFDFKQTTPERTICIDNIMHIIGIINNIVAKYFGIKNNLDSYVLMKAEPFYNKKKLLYSDGFHIQYPNLIISSHDRFLIYQESRKEIIRQDLFSEVYSVLVKVSTYKKQDDSETQSDNNDDDDLETEDTINNYYSLSDKEKEKINDEIFDPSVIIKNKWFLYGSGKNIDGDINVYQLAYIFDYNIDEIEDKPSLKELVKILSIRKPTNNENQIKPIQTNEYNELIEQVKSKYIKKQSDKIFDINKLFIKQTNTDNQENIELNTNKKILDFTKNQFNKTPTEQENIAYAKELVKLLSKERAGPYEEWISVGWCLYNISPSLLQEFIEFSKLAGKKFDKGGCEKVWDDCYRRSSGTGYSIPSLIKWAKEDSPDKFKELLRKKLNKTLEGRDLRTDFDVAHIVHEYYKYDYVCSGIEKKVWWEFADNKWNRIDSAYSLSIKLSTELAHEFAHLSSDIVKLAIVEQGQSSDILHKKSKTIMDLIFNLKKTAFKDRIIKEAAGLYIQKNFESKLDQNIYLVGFANGVYDLKNRVFRKGEPDDYIRKNVGYNYKEFKRDDPTIIEIEAFLESIQPEKDMRDYLGAYLASFLEGSNKDQKFMIWTGCHAINQGIMMADGNIKKVQDIKLGEQLMGDDLMPRNVLKLIRGRGQMYSIKSKENEFIVNDEHILTLCYYNKSPSINLKLKVYNDINNLSLNIKENKTSIDYNNIMEYSEEYINRNILKNHIIIDISVKDLLNSNVDLKYFKLFKKNSNCDNIILNGLEITKQNIDDYYGFRLDGNNRYLMDDFTVTHNCGQNGKGSLIDLIDNTFNGSDDGYFATLPPTVLTQKRGSSSAATPELATKFGKRVIVLQEPEGDDKINVGFMKNITGQDKIEARPLYGDPFQYTPLFKLLLACNHLPSIPSDDGGTWRRIRVIDFMIKFTSNPQGPNERKTDPELREKMKKWNQAFMWLLINVYYPLYKENNGLDKLEPDRVKTSTDKYKADSNSIMEFFNESLEKDSESEIILNDIYESFKSWYIGSYNDKKPIQRKKFKEYFETNNFKVITSPSKGIVIKGVRIKDHNVVEINENNEFDM
jgi:P4 family phage/plasmid primase-like protien